MNPTDPNPAGQDTHAAVPSSATGAVVLLSGGMDSTTLLHYVCRELCMGPVYALSCRYGQKHTRELVMADHQARAVSAREHRVVDLAPLAELTQGGSALTDPALAVPDLSELDAEVLRQPPTYVPNRNLVLLSLAAAWAESLGVSDVYYGAQAQDEYGYWDCTQPFVETLNKLLALNHKRPVRVHAPFVGWRKVDVLKKGLALEVDYSHTWTCYRGGTAPCGTCPSCVERATAFRRAGMPDPLTEPAEGGAARGEGEP